MFADCCATTAFLSLRPQRRPCRAEIEEKLLPLLRSGVRTSSFPRSAGMLDIDIPPYFICRLRVPQALHQTPVLRAAAPGAQCYQVGVGVPEFADRANTHAAPLAHGFIGSNDADNKRFNSGQRRSG